MQRAIFLAHVLSFSLIFNSLYHILSEFNHIVKSNLTLMEAMTSPGLFAYPITDLELAVERQNEFIENFNSIQREEIDLEKLMIHAELLRVNGHVKDYENQMRSIRERASESNRVLKDILEGFPLKEQAQTSLIIKSKNAFHHFLLSLYHLGYILGHGGSSLRLSCILLQGIVGIGALLHVRWTEQAWLMYFVYMGAQMLLAIRDLRATQRASINNSQITPGSSQVIAKREAALLERLRVQYFHHACLYGLTNVMKAILKSEFKDIEDILNSENGMGLSGLHLVAMRGHTDIYQLWMSSKSLNRLLDVNKPTPKGESPLFLAIQSEHPALVKRLIKSCDIAKKDYVLAFRSEQFDVFNLLYSKRRPALGGFSYLDAYVQRFNALLSQQSQGAKRSSNLEFYIHKIHKILSEETSGSSVHGSSPIALAEFFECPVCFEEMREKIYACVFDHWLCHHCFDSLDSCPCCRLSFTIPRNYYRAINAQKIAQIVFGET